MKTLSDRRLIIVSNRLPIILQQNQEEWTITPSCGGLVTALAPVMRKNGGVWLGWPGCDEVAPLASLFADFEKEQHYQLAAVPLSCDEVEEYYWNFSNGALWPLFHDLLGYCNFTLKSWQAYNHVNRLFAEKLAELHEPDDFIWIHDYHLTLVAMHMRRMKQKQQIAYFHHIPFPPYDLFRRLPWSQAIIRGLLEYDLLGFQTLHDRRNFVNIASTMVPDLRVMTRQRHYTLLDYRGKVVKVGHYPISIDFTEFDKMSHAQAVDEAAWFLHENLEDRQIVLGVDRLDYTKGLPERFLAFERALEKYPQLIQHITLLQVVVPSRTLVPDYQDLKGLLDQLAGRINARFGEPCWMPIHYVYRSLNRVQLLAHYRTAEIALITPLRDGMNLVAKEYCASSINNNGVLILSELTGAAVQLGKYALLVNPYDLESTADAIFQAYSMDQPERQRRMQGLRATIRRHDVYHWVNSFIKAIPNR